MATTRAVLRDARHDGPSDRPTAAHGDRRRRAAILDRARAQLQRHAAARRAGRAPDARATAGRRHARAGQSPESLRTAHRRRFARARSRSRTNSATWSRSRKSEHQIITAYEVHAGRPADVTLWTPALGSAPGHLRPRAASGGGRSRLQLRGQRTGGHRSRRATRRASRGAGRSPPARRAYERQAWFRRGQRWRVGCEGRISVIKRRHGLRRCRYHGVDGMHRWVGLGVIADNLINMATVLGRRAAA